MSPLTGVVMTALLWLAPGVAVAQNFQSAAPQIVLMDAETGGILFDVGGDVPVTPASLVKLMTAEVIFREIDAGRLKLDDEFVTSENAWRRGGAPAGGSAMFLAPNSRPKISDLLQGLIVASGNDAAIVLAEGMSGSEATFANLMNERAQAIGLTRSSFRNATGWSDPGQRVTMRDMVRLADHIIRTYPEHYKIFAQREMLWNKVRQQNRNPLLTMDMGADGLKTGYLEESGYSLVGSAVQNGQRLIVAMSGLKTARDRQIEAKKIIDWGFRSFEIKTIFNGGAEVGEAKIHGGARDSVPLVTKADIRLPVPRGAADRMSARITYRGPILAPVATGAEVARIQVFRGNAKVLEAPLVTAADVPRGTLTQRATDGAVELGRSLIRNGFQRLTKKSDAAP
ncbi:MAG: D-alanyl-D-alanine carboxypeptidase [Proteobacteria bacterium]|nr:D-alanyl-D-alanine carboxypeptidase [Pseudomonadota bacterium]